MYIRFSLILAIIAAPLAAADMTAEPETMNPHRCAEIPAQPVTTTIQVAPALVQGLASTKVSVFYLTNRSRSPDKAMADIYGDERGHAQFGRCEVAFSPIPAIDQIAEKVPFLPET
jgi:hypothetical protein